MHDIPARTMTGAAFSEDDMLSTTFTNNNTNDKDAASKLNDAALLELGKDDSAGETEAISVESESTPEPEQLDKLTITTPSSSVPTTNTPIDTDKLPSPQPVTPETPRGMQSETRTDPKELVLPNIEDEKKAQDSSDEQKHDVSLSIETSPTPAVETIDTPSNRKTLSPTSSPDRSRRNSQDQVTATRRSSHSRRSSRSSRRYDDDGSSSDDDSYFATHLPSPKSGRSFSYSSAGSVGAVAPFYSSNNSSRESDASLSFSDESDDDAHHRGVHISPMIPPKRTTADLGLYPKPITRMHSVSSLVSSDSSNEGQARVQHTARRRSSVSSVSSHTSVGDDSDPISQPTAQELGFKKRNSGDFVTPNDKQSPEKDAYGQDFLPRFAQIMSPPAIAQGHMPPAAAMTQDQMANWVAQGPSESDGYGTMNVSNQQHSTVHQFSERSESSTAPSVAFVYSEDEDVSFAHPINRLSGGISPHGDALRIHEGPFRSGGGHEPDRSQSPAPPGARSFQEARMASQVSTQARVSSSGAPLPFTPSADGRGFQVYWRRWLMLLYMSVLNLLSDWTCYSVAPISMLTEEAFGNIDPERLVVVFLGANAIASISEPIILSRLGLRRTVLFGALLLMIGSIVKSGGVPPILQSDMTVGHSEWRLYLGFFLVGLSQPLYQCTPTLLSSSWFPEEERTMATGVALNANQLGIGFAFVFGTLLVGKKEDIIPYFGLLSTLSTIVFLGALIQFDDAPPTPPSSSARVVRGTLDVKFPNMNKIVESVRGGFGPRSSDSTENASSQGPDGSGAAEAPSGNTTSSRRKESKPRRSSRRGSSTRRRTTQSRSSTAMNDSGLSAPSSALGGSTRHAMSEISRIRREAAHHGLLPPSPMMPGRVDSTEGPSEHSGEEQAPGFDDGHGAEGEQPDVHQPQLGENPMYPGYGVPPPGFFPPPGMGPPPPGMGPPPPGMGPPPPPGMVPPYGMPGQQYQYQYWDPRVQQQIQQQQQAFYQQQFYYYQQMQPPHPHAGGNQQPPYMYPPMPYPTPYAQYDYLNSEFAGTSALDDGAEPVLTITPHHLDIDIRDDQVIRSLRACFARQGFVHALVAFAASGIVINTLSTYMDYLVRLNGAPRAYTGIVGGTFQFVIMISSLIIGKFTDHSRAYYSITIAMLVLGAFGLAECGVSLDSDRGDDLRWTLIIVAVLVGPLQPVSTELGVDVVYPLSENTVLVIQQLFSNLLSALFIPIFKSLKDFGSNQIDDSEMYERPEYTFSFYLLIVIHTAATVFFATFNGKYLRYEHELQKKAEEERRDQLERAEQEALHPLFRDQDDFSAYGGERQPLMTNSVV